MALDDDVLVIVSMVSEFVVVGKWQCGYNEDKNAREEGYVDERSCGDEGGGFQVPSRCVIHLNSGYDVEGTDCGLSRSLYMESSLEVFL